MTLPVKTNLPKKIRLLVADDHMVMRMGLVHAASAQSDLEVIAEVESGGSDVTFEIPYEEFDRLKAKPGLVGQTKPV